MTDPILFTDSLGSRAYLHKSLRIGNPYSFLNQIGITSILEQVYRGQNVVDIAETLGITITILLNWLENEGYSAKFEDATKLGAEGYISEAGKLLRAAKTEFELKKADKIASHGRFMAGKLNKERYGDTQKNQMPHQGVTFVMHMGTAAPAQISLTQAPTALPPPPESNFIDGTFNLITKHLIPQPDEDAAYTTPTGVAVPEELGPFEDEPFLPEPDSIPRYLKQA